MLALLHETAQDARTLGFRPGTALGCLQYSA
jgi:hypothetical protein